MPFLPPCLRVDDQVFDAIAPHTPVSTVQVSDPVAALLYRGFGNALDSCAKAKRVVVPVRRCTSRLTIEVPGYKGPRPSGCIGDTANWGKDQRSSEAVIRQPCATSWSSVVIKRERLRSAVCAGMGWRNSGRQRLTQKLPTLGSVQED